VVVGGARHRVGELVRVSQELIYAARQLEGLRVRLAVHFERKPALTMAEFKDMTATSRKYAVPLLKHCDRLGWTVRSGDERKRGGGARSLPIPDVEGVPLG